MLGERSDQRGLWEADRLYLDHVGRESFYGLLASMRRDRQHGRPSTTAPTVRPWPWCWLRMQSTESGYRYWPTVPVSVMRSH